MPSEVNSKSMTLIYDFHLTYFICLFTSVLHNVGFIGRPWKREADTDELACNTLDFFDAAHWFFYMPV